MGVQARNRDFIGGMAKRFLSSPKHPDRLWGPPSVFKGYRLLISLE